MEINPKSTLDNLGGKGYNLNLLKDICDVPEFFVIKFDNFQEIEDEEIQKEILNYYKEKQFDLVSVRSSATVEDSKQASFAGMFDSVLNVNETNLIDAIQKVIKSVKGNRVIEYCKTKGIDYSKVGMRVVVQKMVISRVSGVCFTRTPESNKIMMIEACLGLGEVLVSGRVTPDNYIIDKNTLGVDDTSIGYQNVMLKNKEYEEVPFNERNSKKLANKEIQELIEVSLRIDSSLGFGGTDIEWAIENNKLYILQARAITFESKSQEKEELLPSIQNYQLTFKVTGLDFMFADLLCRGFGYLHPLFICHDGYFLQYFTNEKMQYAANYGYDWLSAKNGYDEYKKEFTNFHESSFKILEEILENEITSEKIKQFFEIIYQYFIFYSKNDFQFTNTTYLYADKNPIISENLQKLSAFKVMYDGQNIKYVCGEKAVEYISNVKKFEQSQLKNELSGQVANKGIEKEVIGKVKIINVNYSDFSEMEKAIEEMNKGEILVSESTAPELMVACTKAKAIVTDMGGMLSHAAIVSRELGIPCIVGTVHASRSLKDGDNIKIDLDTGNIEIL